LRNIDSELIFDLQGGNPLVNEFIPKLSHSSSSPNFSSMNNGLPPNMPPPNSTATSHIAGL